MSKYLNVIFAKFSLFFSQVYGHWVDFLLLCDTRCVYMEHCNRFKSPIRMKMLHVNTSIGIKIPKPNEIVIGLRGVG